MTFAKTFGYIYLLLCLSCLLCYTNAVADSKLKELNDYKFPNCQACKLLVASFKKGLDRTSRGQLEGGDTDWEEKKKLSYSKSEIRFLEIMEHICGDIEKGKHQCQSLAEEFENYFEEYWQTMADSVDLSDWLCNKKISLCCPEGHYGANCVPCAGYPNNICSNSGKCKGSGTRKGNGECSCNIGYEGASCNQCAIGYFESYKDDNKLLCSACHQSCLHSCTQAGPRGCLACQPGWKQDSEQGCLDINECMIKMNACSASQFCVNNQGSYSCLACDKACARCDGDGPDMCLQCADGYELRNNICEDVRKSSTERSFNITRYITYFGLCVATCIIFQRNTLLASIIGLTVALYISLSEYMLVSSKPNPDLSSNLGNIFSFV